MAISQNIRLEDPDPVDGGAAEAMLEAKKGGKVHYRDLPGTKIERSPRMLEMADEHNFRFDTVQMPLNVMDAHFRSFGAKGSGGLEKLRCWG